MSIGLSACSPAIDDVHHRRRQDTRSNATHIAIKRRRCRLSRRLRAGERDPENSVGAEPTFVFCAVEGDQRFVDIHLFFGFKTGERIKYFAVDGSDSILHALAAVTRPAVAQFVSLVSAGRCARRDRGAALRSVFQRYFNLDGRVAAAVENFPAKNVDYGGHG